jgi:hypothetical protein
MTWCQSESKLIEVLQGAYSILLGVNVVGTCLAWGLFWFFSLENRPGCASSTQRCIHHLLYMKNSLFYLILVECPVKNQLE